MVAMKKKSIFGTFFWIALISVIVVGGVIWGISKARAPYKEFTNRVIEGKIQRHEYQMISFKSGEDEVFKPDENINKKILKHEGYTKSGVEGYVIKFVGKKGVERRVYERVLVVYTKKVNKPVYSAYYYDDTYWNPIIFMPESKLKKVIQK